MRSLFLPLQGDVEIAKQLIRSAKACGADAVKFQKRTITAILTKAALAKPYTDPRKSFGPTYGEHRAALELDEPQWRAMKACADEAGILFTGSGWDEASVDFLDRIGVPFFKMASADLTNLPLMRHTAAKGKPMVVSTGMADLATVRATHDVLAAIPGCRFVLLHCCSAYPCPDELLNLRCIATYV